MLFVCLPLLALFVNVSWSGVIPVLSNPVVQSAVGVSLSSATLATCITAVFGVPLGYVLAHYRFPGRAILGGLVYFPLVLPPIVSGILLIFVWGRTGSIGRILEPHGYIFVEEFAGVVICQMFVCSPFIVVAARSAFERLDRDLDEAARTMGAGTFQIFWSIALPLSVRPILAGLTLAWMRSFGEFGATAIIAYHPFSLPTYVYNEVDLVPISQMLPLALLAVALCAVVLVVVGLLERVGTLRLLLGRD